MINREKFLTSTIEKFEGQSKSNLLKGIEIEFYGESGVDSGKEKYFNIEAIKK